MYGIPAIRPAAPADPTQLFSLVRAPVDSGVTHTPGQPVRSLCALPLARKSPAAAAIVIAAAGKTTAGSIGSSARYLRAGPAKTLSSHHKHEKPAHGFHIMLEFLGCPICPGVYPGFAWYPASYGPIARARSTITRPANSRCSSRP